MSTQTIKADTDDWKQITIGHPDGMGWVTLGRYIHDLEAEVEELKRRLHTLTPEQWNAFVVALDAPAADNPRLRALLADD